MKPAIANSVIRTAGMLGVLLVPACQKALVHVAEPVGPTPVVAPSPTLGRLVVATERIPPYPDEDTVMQYEPYTVQDASGRVVKEVSNDSGADVVQLEEGRYSIRAESPRRRVITVDVQIVRGTTTEVHLDGNWTPKAPSPQAAVVLGPDGNPVGYRAASAP